MKHDSDENRWTVNSTDNYLIFLVPSLSPPFFFLSPSFFLFTCNSRGRSKIGLHGRVNFSDWPSRAFLQERRRFLSPSVIGRYSWLFPSDNDRPARSIQRLITDKIHFCPSCSPTIRAFPKGFHFVLYPWESQVIRQPISKSTLSRSQSSRSFPFWIFR